MLPLLNIVTRTYKPTTYYEEEKQNGIRRFKRKRNDYAGSPYWRIWQLTVLFRTRTQVFRLSRISFALTRLKRRTISSRSFVLNLCMLEDRLLRTFRPPLFRQVREPLLMRLSSMCFLHPDRLTSCRTPIVVSSLAAVDAEHKEV